VTWPDGIALAVGVTTALLITHQPRKAHHMTTHTQHLWEYDHPYYCAEGNYFKIGQHEHFASWQDFT
jgi:hypothetical protein